MREHCSIGKNLQAHPRIRIFSHDEDEVTEVDEGDVRNAVLWSIVRSLSREELARGEDCCLIKPNKF